MKITVIGAAGMAGSRVVTEAVRRGHHVTAVIRSSRPDALPAEATLIRGDATDVEHLRSLLGGADAIVGATRPAPGEEDTVAATTSALLDAAAAAETRALLIGGAAPLLSPAGGLVFDDDRFVPSFVRPIAAASIVQWEVCRTHDADWVYLSPPAMLEPGVRTGAYRRGTTTLVVAADGTSRISAEDFAVAVVDELENPGPDRHITVGY
ncbi:MULTISPECIES: NAD(P)-dependent oxidoreductase [Actinoalloteichus]|uniref:NADH-flavin reductase n=1 Tax=Actinoalloteichus fjordicus TaxID=1612552 RepID=A0AAC9LC68_9PSEU|nr:MULTISPECIES: NAD(P)H-binding protein [Actinoalloteichus]APU15103.1 putative NADH-flavin reductase [Actinoalloteichus fjordicus]APU21171.1 putative NADH-flavin reductase [Actinoalloteichus sp. GBA129-24]